MTLYIKAIAAALVVVFLFGLGWTANGWQSSKTIAELRTEQAQDRADRAEAARTEETKTAIKESKHAQDTIYNADRLANLKTGIAVDVRSELDRAERLHLNSERRAATYRAQAQADAAARRDLADQAAALDASLAEGLGVVAEIGGALKQRDAEVAVLCDQVNIERRLIGGDESRACSRN